MNLSCCRRIKTGTLTLEEFENYLVDFLEKAKKVGDPWNVQFAKGKRQVKYLMKHQVHLGPPRISIKGSEGTSADDEDWGIDEENEECIVTTTCQSGSTKEFYKYEYHVIYSISYAVPVLYFTASQSDGKLVSLEDVWENVPDVYRSRLEHEKWTFITQQEHPYLGVPFYQLHPCHTADLMKRVLSVQQDQNTQRLVNYLVTWLSTVGPVVGLNISREYCNRRDLVQTTKLLLDPRNDDEM